MKKDYVMLNAFRLNDALAGEGPAGYDGYLVPDCGPIETYDLSPRFPFTARLYVSGKTEKEPPWATYLRTGFSDLPKLLNIKTTAALLIIGVDHKGKKIHFALSFGFGRYLLGPASYLHDYGLKVALNAIYKGLPKGVEVDTNIIQSLDLKTVSENTIHTRRQSNRRASFDTFGVDVQRDILRSITGQPADEKWGSRISGSDSVTLTCEVDFGDLGDRCKQVEGLYRRKDYREFVGWIDHIKPVTDPSLISALEASLLKKLAKDAGDLGTLELAPPEIVDWDSIKHFSFSFDPKPTYKELSLADFLAALDRKDLRKRLTVKQLKSGFRIRAFDHDEELYREWNALQCLSGELSYQNKTYILEEGGFTAVDGKYLSDVDSFIRSLREYGGKFPKCLPNWKEDDFNVNSGLLPNYVLMHKHTVTLPEKTTPIEVCDLLSADKCFIHVKPKFSSSTLSHLFSQGYVSGELFSTNMTYRSRTFDGIRAELSQKKSKSALTAPLQKLADSKPESTDPRDYKIVYAIIGDWKGKEFVAKLPFFSKLNLRRFALDLKSMGYEVMCKRIQKP